MFRVMREFVSLFVAFSLALVTPAPVFARSMAKPAAVAEGATSPEFQKLIRNDAQLIYWSTLAERNPLVSDFALNGGADEKPLWTIGAENPLVDQDPFFMRSQSWSEGVGGDCNDGVCFEKTTEGLTLQFGNIAKTLLLKQAMTPILDTEDYLFMSADNQDLFRAKVGRDVSEPGEGFFYIAKKDLFRSLKYSSPLPIFFLPTEGSGWTGPQPDTAELTVGDKMAAQFLFPDRDGDPLQIDYTDVAALEKVSRNNLQVAESWSALEGAIAANGVALPKIGTTMLFGLQLTGQLPRIPDTTAAVAKKQATLIARAIGQAVLPQAEADQERLTLGQRLAGMLGLRRTSFEPVPPPSPTEGNAVSEQSTFRRWLPNFILYGGTAALAAAAYQDIDWKALITDDMPSRITHISMIFGGVALTSYMLKIGKYKDKLAKLYPVGPDSPRMAAAKGFLTIFSQGLWTSYAGVSMMIRQILDFGKDRFFPNNKMIHVAWEATMGYALKASSSITTNWKTAGLGWIFGLADATMVAVDLLIFAPWLMQHLGMSDVGAATVAYASAAVLSQFVGYAQTGPHAYAQDTKTIHFISAQNEARRQMQAQGLDPDNSRNEGKLNKLTAAEMEKRFKAVGLPSDDEFFFDPLSLWHDSLKKLGYSIERLEGLSDEDRKKLMEQDFVLSHRHLGLIKPAMQSALREAELLQSKSPSKAGAQTVELLSWALRNLGLGKPILERVWDISASSWAWNGLKEAVDSSMIDWLSKDPAPNFIGKYQALTRGIFTYLAADSTKAQRDMRSVLFTMSTSNTEAVMDSLKFLPKSWVEKAGSKEAAGLGAELFHRHFIGYIEKNIDRVNKTENFEANLGPRADAQLEKIAAVDDGLANDPFARAVRRAQILTQLKTIDEEQKEIDEWQPPKEGWLAKRQWRKALEGARQAMGNPDDQISEEWIALAKTYASNLGPERAAAFDPKSWVRDQRFRYLVTQNFAKQVGLYLNGAEESDFVQKVLVKATQATESALTKGAQAYHEKLSAEDREVFMAKVFTEQFINMYVGMSVHTDLFLKAASPEFPGRLQRARKWLFGRPIAKLLNGPIHVAEMLGRNEESSYKPGVASMLDRSLPFFPDLYHNMIRTLRMLPYAAGPAYLTQRYIFQINYPYVMWLATIIFGSTNGAFVEINNRMQRNLDKKPMGGIPEKLLFARMHSLFTNPQAVLELMYAEPIVRNVDHGVEALLQKCDDVLRSVGTLNKQGL